MTMDAAAWYFDVISPFAYLHFKEMQRWPLAVPRIAKPVLFAGLLQHWNNVGPAEIVPKRQFIYEYCTWYGAAHGIPFVMPSAHPFNPLRYLRLIIACGCTDQVISAVFDAVYTTGDAPDLDQTWNPLCVRLGVMDADALIARSDAKNLLIANTGEAAQAGVFGVPTVVVDRRPFWGLDALPMLHEFLADRALFERPEMRRIAQVRVAASRPQFR